MNRKTFFVAVISALFMVTASPIEAQLMPDVGWAAELSNDFHNVSGTVSILDADTLLVDSFTFDGQGLAVYFYLGASDMSSDFATGLQLGDDLVGTAFDGTQPSFTVDLPAGTTVDGYHAISVWCVTARASFGSGTFFSVPEPTTVSLLGAVFAITYGRRRFVVHR